MKSLPNLSPTNVAALDERDPNSGNAHHRFGVQFGGPDSVLIVQFQHGPRGVEGSKPGVFDDDLLTIIQERLEGFQSGRFTCPENEEALEAVRAARAALGRRVATRIAQGVLGVNKEHK